MAVVTDDPAAGTASVNLARILVVEDNPTVAEIVARYLRREGYEVEVAHDGLTGLSSALRGRPDLVVLDVVLPGMNGLAVLQGLRAGGEIPVILLTGRGAEPDRIAGLQAGADDYLVKPFSPGELVARVAAVLRRSLPVPLPQTGPLSLGPVELDPSRRTVLVRGLPVTLTALEFDLLAFLLAHPREVFKRGDLLERVWGFSVGDTATVTVHVGRLRTKIEVDPANPSLIRTVWGVGYSYDPPET